MENTTSMSRRDEPSGRHRTLNHTRSFLLWLGLAFTLLYALVGGAGCSTSTDRCVSHYNCPAQQYCVSGRCLGYLPLGTPGPSEIPPWEFVGGDAGSQVESGASAGLCKTRRDCKAPTRPNCHEGQCVPGYLSVDLTKGHVLVDRSLPVTACRSDGDCRSWQQCYLGYCRDLVGTENQALGRWLAQGVSLGDLSYTTLIDGKAGKILRTVMLGSNSEKRQWELQIDIPQGRLVLGEIPIDGVQVTAKLSLLFVDTQPIQRQVVAHAIGGTLTWLQTPKAWGQRCQGKANLILGVPE